VKRPSEQSNLEAEFLTRWRQLAPRGLPEPVGQVKFCGRKYAWDWAWGCSKVAVEMQGGTWKRGAHNREPRYSIDCEKSIIGQCLGWMVIWLSGPMIRDDPLTWISIIADAVKTRQYIQSGKEINLNGLDKRKRPG